MQRSELEHLIRAAASITNEYEMVIIGSQAILGSFPNAPAELLQSTEADIYPRHAPEKSDLIEGSIGEDSVFADTYGYYAQGVRSGDRVAARRVGGSTGQDPVV